MDVKLLKKEQFEAWDKLVAASGASIWQSSEFADFQLQVPGRTKRWIFGLFERDELVGGMQIYRFELRSGYCWFYGGRGPVLAADYAAMHVLLQEIRLLADKEKAVFLRLDPDGERVPKWGREIVEGFQPQTTLVLDLQVTEEEILSQMKQKGRYNIRLAAKRGVEIVEGSVKDLPEYEKLLAETTERDGFTGHKIDFYKKMLEELSPKGMAKMFLAKHEGQVLAAAICTYFGKIATYYYGVSSNENRHLMAPYLLQWEMIKDAKAAGFEFYDFLGISPADSKGHKWDGVTSFKKKFGGMEINYCRPQEVVYKKLLYFLYRLKRGR